MTVVDAQEIKYPERWLEVIARTYAWCKVQKGDHYEIARRRYNCEDYRKICRELCIDVATISRVLELVRQEARAHAIELGLISARN